MKKYVDNDGNLHINSGYSGFKHMFLYVPISLVANNDVHSDVNGLKLMTSESQHNHWTVLIFRRTKASHRAQTLEGQMFGGKDGVSWG